MGQSPKAIVQTFDNYAKSQLTFVQTVAELASKSIYANFLHEFHAVDMVLLLVTNLNAKVRTNAVLALARLAGNSEECAKQMLCSKSSLNRLFGQTIQENKYYKKNSMNLIKNLTKHSSEFAEIGITECGGIDAILLCMKDFDILVRETTLQAIISVARQDAKLSQLIVDSGILSEIVLCLKEQNQNLKLFALTALSEIAKHNNYLARKIVSVPTLSHVIHFLSPNFTDIKVQNAALNLIKNIVKHSLFLTENAIEVDLFPNILLLLAHPNEMIRNNSSKVISEIVKHSVQVAQMVVNNGGIVSLINVISCSKEFPCTSAVLALGYIAAMSPVLASVIIQSKALIHLTDILKNATDDYMKAGTAWTIGMIGQHSFEHSKSVCALGAVNCMIDIYKDPSVENEAKLRCKNAIELVLKKCDNYFTLEKLLTPSIPIEILPCILDQISKILPKNSKARRSFITNGHLKMIQNLRPEVDSNLFEIIKTVNCCFPEDIIKMVAGDLPESIMKAVDKYVPKNQCLAHDRNLKNEEQLNEFNVEMGNPSSSSEEAAFE